MRIISGTHKGFVLHPPGNLPVRPTTDFSKESLFNIIENRFDIENLTILDLFSGTGAISYEFASRGSKKIISVDLSFKCSSYINSVSRQNSFNAIKVIKSDCLRFLKETSEVFTIIFADPPYDYKAYNSLIETVFSRNLVTSGGWLILEHNSQHLFDDHPFFLEKRKYGQTIISFFEVK